MIDLLARNIIHKFVKFGVVGFSGVFVDFSLTYLGKEKLQIQKYVANAIGFTTAATSNYFLNRWWTFHSKNPEVVLEYSKFLLISLLGLGINTLVIWILVDRFKRNFYVSKLFAIGVVTIWNFLFSLYFTFV